MRYPFALPALQAHWPDAVAEFKFHPSRKWRADFAIPSHMVLIEIDGGTWSNGRHTRGSGFVKDQEKTNAAACLGYHVLRYQPKHATPKGLTIIIANVQQVIAARRLP